MADLGNTAKRRLARLLGWTDAVTMTNTVNAADVLSGTEAGYLDSVSAGTAAASKAVVLGTSKEIATITTATITTVNATNIDAGASGTAGTVDVFPATASKGKFILACQNQDGDTSVTLQPAAMGQASVISIPDPGAATANVVLTDQANDGVVCTATAAELNQLDGTTLTAGSIFANLATTAGAGITGAAANFASSVEKVGALFKTTILVDLAGLGSAATLGDIIGSGGSAAHLGQVTAARNGTIFAGRILCLETPAVGDDDIDLYSATESTGVFDGAIGSLEEAALFAPAGALAAGTSYSLTAFPAADKYLYLTSGNGDTAGTYTAGILLIELWGK